MPTYDYECPKCGHTFEKFQSMNDEPIKTCPECRGRKVRRLIGTGAGIIFKGSGFYTTDYRSDGYTKAAKADASASKTDSSSDKKVKDGGSGDKPKTGGGDKPKAQSSTRAKSKSKKKGKDA